MTLVRRRLLVWGVAGAAGLLLLGGGGYALQTLQARHRDTLQQLQATEATLAQRQEALATLEDEHRRLSDAYETLKGRWAKTEEELQRSTKTSEQTTQELNSVTSERTKLQTELGALKGQLTQLQQQAQALEQQRAALAAEKASLSGQLHETSGLSQRRAAQLERITGALALEEQREQQLSDRMAELSRAYEQLAQAGAGSPVAPGPSSDEPPRVAPPQRPTVREQEATRIPAVPAPTMPPRASKARPSQEREQARLYREMGLAYANVHSYKRAAAILERSLAYEDDTTIHQQLARLYRDHLQQPALAERHAAQGATESAAASIRPASGSDTDERPRSGWRLVWDWLVK